MSVKPYTSFPYGALASVFAALAIGSAPVAILLALSAQIGGVK